jgi:hypothetical protein
MMAAVSTSRTAENLSLQSVQLVNVSLFRKQLFFTALLMLFQHELKEFKRQKRNYYFAS